MALAADEVVPHGIVAMVDALLKSDGRHAAAEHLVYYIGHAGPVGFILQDVVADAMPNRKAKFAMYSPRKLHRPCRW